MSDTRAPIPLCNDNPLFTLPGDGSIAGFVRGLGQDISQIAIDIVLQELELKVSYPLSVSVLSWNPGPQGRTEASCIVTG